MRFQKYFLTTCLSIIFAFSVVACAPQNHPSLVDPSPVDPSPVDPSPVDPSPVDPSPVDPSPVDPSPVDPPPVDPSPVDPSPVDPSPVDPPDETVNYEVLTDISSVSLVAGDELFGVTKLTAEVLRDGNQFAAVPEYSSADPSVAEIDYDGKITAKGYGKTTVSASYEDAWATVEVTVFETATAEDINSFSETYVGLFGRTYERNNAIYFDNPATGFEVSFLGEKLTADIGLEGNVYICIYTDGNTAPTRVKIPSSGSIVLAEGLPHGIHTIRILKSSEVNKGAFSLRSLNADCFLRAQKTIGPKIEFIGDSITAGYGDLSHQGPTWTLENSDACSTYACLSALSLDADFSVVALSGICVKKHIFVSVNMEEMHPLTSLRTNESWTYETDVDIVVLNLGTNDGRYILLKDAEYANHFSDDYMNFVMNLRNIYPNAYIICIYGMMGKVEAIDDGIKDVVTALQDEKIIYLDVFEADLNGAESHPCKEAHEQYAKQLTEYIETLPIG